VRRVLVIVLGASLVLVLTPLVALGAKPSPAVTSITVTSRGADAAGTCILDVGVTYAPDVNKVAFVTFLQGWTGATEPDATGMEPASGGSSTHRFTGVDLPAHDWWVWTATITTKKHLPIAPSRVTSAYRGGCPIDGTVIASYTAP
jgi:hypothetical protein